MKAFAKIIIPLLGVFLHSSDLHSEVNQTEESLVIATMTDNPPYGVITPDGEISGYYTELWRLWAKKNDRKVTFLSGDYNQSMEYLKNGLADIHSGLFINEERQQEYLFTRAFDKIDIGIFYLKNQEGIDSLNDIKTSTVGIHPEYDPIRFVKEEYPDLSLVYKNSPVLKQINS